MTLFQSRVKAYLEEILATRINNEQLSKKPLIKGVCYAGGTLCISIRFWSDVNELILLNIDGHMNSTIYGDGRMTEESLAMCREIYRASKGVTPYSLEKVEASALESKQA